MKRCASLGVLTLGVLVGAVYVASCGKDTPLGAAAVTVTYSRVAANATSVSCPSGSYVVGGGCAELSASNCGNGSGATVKYSAPKSPTEWGCDMRCSLNNVTGTPQAATGTPNVTTFAICAAWSPTDGVVVQDLTADF